MRHYSNFIPARERDSRWPDVITIMVGIGIAIGMAFYAARHTAPNEWHSPYHHEPQVCHSTQRGDVTEMVCTNRPTY